MKNKVTFFGDKGWIFLCSIVLAAIGGLAFVACDDGSTDEPDPPTKVTLAAGSQGTAGDKTITGLTAQQKYLVKTNGKWHKVKADGTLDAAFTPLKASVAGTVAALTGTKITGLANGQTYDVYIYFKPAASGTIGGASGVGNDTKKKNAMIDLTGIGASSATGLISEAAAAGDQTTLVFLMKGDRGIKSGGGFAGVLVDSQVVNSGDSGNGGAYTFTTAQAGGAVLNAVVTEAFFTVSKISSTTSITKIDVAAGS